MQQTKASQKRKRGCFCWMTIIMGILLLLVGIGIAIKFIFFKSGCKTDGDCGDGKVCSSNKCVASSS